MAYQIGFDLYESGTQQFLQRVQSALRATAPVPIPSAKSESPAKTATDTDTVKTEDKATEGAADSEKTEG